MISRRGIIGVLSGLIAAPTIVKATSLMPVNSALAVPDVSMRMVTEYAAGDAPIEQLDVLFGNPQVRPEWDVHAGGLTIGDVVTFGSDAPSEDQRQFIVTHVNGNSASIYPQRSSGAYRADQSELRLMPSIDALAENVADCVMRQQDSANSLLTVDQITRESVKLFKNNNMFLKNIEQQYDRQFAVEGARIGNTLRIRLPNDYAAQYDAKLDMHHIYEKPTPQPVLSAPAAVALGAAAVVAANPVVSRRFWK